MNSTLSADRPQTDPSQDLFGYAPFAQRLTKALCNYGSSDPLVLGLYGDWGSGKSTILKFICHNLKEVPENERPIVIEFNPWWFSGQEHLARAFLGQLQAALPKKYAAFKKLGELLGNFSESIGGAIDTVAPTGGFGKKVGSLIKSIFKRPPKDVPALKEEICAILQQSGKRIIIMVDDIDRLEAEEMRQLFTVIKALADFPNVIYLLAFDQAVVVQAIEKYSGMPGQAYLEKIIQVPFVVPHVDRTVLLNGLANRLEEILEGTPEYLCDQTHWNSFFYNGFDKLFTVPRDIVRFCNTVSVTYPAVRGEVNAVDFIVIEAIRIFLPKLYKYILENSHEFVSDYFGEKISDQKLENILNNFVKTKSIHQHMEKILKLLFPYIANNNFVYQLDERRKLPIGHGEIFPCYFHFSPPSDTISSAEIRQWLEKAGDADAFGSVLLQAKAQGMSRVHMYLDRLRDHIDKDIQEKDIPVVISVLLNIGDELLESLTDLSGTSFLTNHSLVIASIELLGRRLSLADRLSTFERALQNGNALAIQCGLLGDSERAIEKGREQLIPDEELPRFKALWLEKVDDRIINDTLLSHQDLAYILAVWLHWSSDDSKIKQWCAEITASDDAMLAFIRKFISRIRRLGNGKITYYIKPQVMESYIDIEAFESRILALQAEGKIPQEYEETAKLFLQGVALWREGKTPEDIF